MVAGPIARALNARFLAILGVISGTIVGTIIISVDVSEVLYPRSGYSLI